MPSAANQSSREKNSANKIAGFFFKWTNQWLQIGAPDQGQPTSRSKIILTHQMTGFATRAGQNSCKNHCHLFWLTDAVALIGLCNWITIANIIRPLTANNLIIGLLSKFYVGRITALATSRPAPELKVKFTHITISMFSTCLVDCKTSVNTKAVGRLMIRGAHIYIFRFCTIYFF